MNFPGVSIIIPVLNNERTIKKCLECVTFQDYPKNKVEILILDGGSTDKTIAISKSSKSINLHIIKGGYRNNMEARRSIGFQKAKHNLVLVLDSDNYLYSPDSLRKLVKPMLGKDRLVGSFTLHYHYDSRLPLFTRYISLFGNHDPVAYYLHKADRQKITQKTWPHKNQIVSTKPEWTIVQFNKKDFPTLGCNGFLINKKYLHLKDIKPENFLHTDILYDLLDKGLNKYAVVDAQVVHDSSSSIKRHLEKRYEYMQLHHISLAKIRRYKVFDSDSPQDRLRLGKFILYTVTIVRPLYESIEGFFQKPDLAWFIHPFLCWAFLITYSFAVVNPYKKG